MALSTGMHGRPNALLRLAQSNVLASIRPNHVLGIYRSFAPSPSLGADRLDPTQRPHRRRDQHSLQISRRRAVHAHSPWPGPAATRALPRVTGTAEGLAVLRSVYFEAGQATAALRPDQQWRYLIY